MVIFFVIVVTIALVQHALTRSERLLRSGGPSRHPVWTLSVPAVLANRVIESDDVFRRDAGLMLWPETNT